MIMIDPTWTRSNLLKLDPCQDCAEAKCYIDVLQIPRVKTLTFLIAASLLACALRAHEFETPALKILHPWARPTVPGRSAGGGFLTIENKSRQPDRLLGGSSPAGRVELHQMSMDGSIMRMREIEGIDLPPGAKVELKAGGLHIMLMDLKAPLKLGDKLPLTLRFKNAGEVKIEMWVAIHKTGATADPHKHH